MPTRSAFAIAVLAVISAAPAMGGKTLKDHDMTPFLKEVHVNIANMQSALAEATRATDLQDRAKVVHGKLQRSVETLQAMKWQRKCRDLGHPYEVDHRGKQVEILANGNHYRREAAKLKYTIAKSAYTKCKKLAKDWEWSRLKWNKLRNSVKAIGHQRK